MTDPFFNPDPLSVGSKGLVYVGERIVVYRRDSKGSHPMELDVPGGAREGNETPFQTFQREVLEEFSLSLTEASIAYTRRYASTLQPGKFAWFVVAQLPKTAEYTIVFGNEGTEYMLLEPAAYLDRTDAWRVFQERTADYLHTIHAS